MDGLANSIAEAIKEIRKQDKLIAKIKEVLSRPEQGDLKKVKDLITKYEKGE